jgi:hypothetical protein
VTVRPKYNTMAGQEYAKLIANGSFSFTRSEWWESTRSETRPLDLNDLQDPPASAYYDARMDCWGADTESHCATITDGSFRPKLQLAPDVWVSIFSILPCTAGLVVDPPIALQEIEGGASPNPDIPLPILPTPRPTAVSQDSPHAGDDYMQLPLPAAALELHQPKETGTSPLESNTAENAAREERLLKSLGWYAGEQLGSGGFLSDLMSFLFDNEDPYWKKSGESQGNGKKSDGQAGSDTTMPRVFESRASNARRSPFAFTFAFVLSWIRWF